jgi:hypothetical protein
VRKTNGLQRGCYYLNDPYPTWQRLRNGRLDDQVSGVAKRTIGLNSLTVGVRVSNLNNAGKGEKCTAEEAQGDPPRTSDSRIPAALQHAPIINTQSQITQFAPASCLATCEQVRAARQPALFTYQWE